MKKKEIMPFVVTYESGDNMVYSTKWGKSEKDKYHISVLCEMQKLIPIH